jgi:hypothetical protein
VLVECRLENLVNADIYWNSIALSIKQLPYSLESAD